MPNNGTTFEFTGGTRAGTGGNVLLVPLVTTPKPAMQMLSQVDAVCDDAVSELVDVGATGKDVGHLAHTTRGGVYRRIVVVNLGEAKELGADKIRMAAARAAKWLIDERVKRATLWIDGLLSHDVEGPVSEWAGGMTVGGFRFVEHKEPDKDDITKIRIQVASGDPAYLTAKVPRIRAAVVLAQAVNYTRRIAHQPANVINPATLATEARRLARQHKLKCTVLDFAQVKRLGMGGLIAVGRGAEHKPCLIRLDYRGAPRVRPNTVLVGKAITFDTGGYSLKPSQGLEGLKFDKCGGAVVLGVMKAAATLRLPCNLVGLVAAAENAISREAYRPGDILTMASGKTVEVVSTDAEGRLVLADALWYAQKYCKPTALIDLATLTGGVVTALGKFAAGLMSNDDALSAALGESGRRTHERLWRLPLWEEYRELIKGQDSDIKNVGNKRFAHPIVGGMFLKEFVDDSVPWAHIDIAGTATDENEKEATGFGVRLIVDYLRRRLP
ncbi:MAG: M17 family metallopeptidase [Phycisphaerae bacterium]